MIGLPAGVPIYLCTEPVDFRKGFDGLTGIVTTAMNHSVTDGSLFLFVNRRRDRIKALWWETGGLTLWYRRLEKGTVELPKPEGDASHVVIDNVELAMWIAGVSLKSAKMSMNSMERAFGLTWEFVDGETLPDIFHPDYAQLIQSRAAQVCPRYKDDPLCMGYYYGFGAFNKSDEWVNHHFSLPQGSPGREVLSDLLIKRYDNDVAKFNAVYGTSLKDMAELKSTFELTFEKEYERRNYPRIGKSLDPAKLTDFEAIVSHMCVSLYKLGHDAIHRWDDNHLILGSFIKEWALSVDSWKKAAQYVDMIAPQHVNEYISVSDVSAATGLPIIFSDEYFGFHYPGKTGSLHAGLVSHDARGEVYHANLMRHFKDPRVMGVTYCACMYDQGGNTLAKNNQNGFYSLDGKPRKKLIEVVTELNGSIYEHASDPASPEELGKLHTELFDKWKEHGVRRGR